MQLDITLSLIFKEVQKEIKEELGEDLSIEEIGDIVESQFHALILGINLGLGTRIPVFGSFFSNDVSKNIERGKVLAVQKEHMTKEEYKKAQTEVKMLNRADTLAESKKRRVNIKLKDLLSIEEHANINCRYQNILKEYKEFKNEQKE